MADLAPAGQVGAPQPRMKGRRRIACAELHGGGGGGAANRGIRTLKAKTQFSDFERTSSFESLFSLKR